jgi:hypothetical protein
MDVREIHWEILDWIYVTQNRGRRKAAVNVNKSFDSIKDGEFD